MTCNLSYLNNYSLNKSAPFFRFAKKIEALAKVFSCWVWMANKLAAQARL